MVEILIAIGLGITGTASASPPAGLSEDEQDPVVFYIVQHPRYEMASKGYDPNTQRPKPPAPIEIKKSMLQSAVDTTVAALCENKAAKEVKLQFAANGDIAVKIVGLGLEGAVETTYECSAHRQPASKSKRP